MDTKYIKEFECIENLMSSGLDDNEEICNILCEKFGHSKDSAVMTLMRYYKDIKEIKKYFKSKKPSQFGEF